MTKSHFWKLLCCECFPGNFSQYLRAALSSESYTSRWLFWIELYTVISLIFSCVQRNRRIITVVFVIMECKTSSKLIMYLMKLWCSPLFLENFNILEKKWQWEMLWNWVIHGETVRVEMSGIMKFALFFEVKKVLFTVKLDIIPFFESSQHFLYQHNYTL